MGPLPPVQGDGASNGAQRGAADGHIGAARLNRVIELIEGGGVAFGAFLPPGSIADAVWASTSPLDFVVFDMEHGTFSLNDLSVSLQFLLDPRQIVEQARLGRTGPRVVPFARVPINGRERGEWVVKQVLDAGVFGIVFPMINTVEDARHALQAARYPQAAGVADGEPAGRRGHAPKRAVRYWGLTPDEYFDRADVWPLDPRGEILPILQCETRESVANLPAICRELTTPGLILISEGDLSVSLGCRGAYTKEVEAAVREAAQVCREYGVPYGIPQATDRNLAQRIADGFQFLMPGFSRDVSTVVRGQALATRGAAEGTPIA